MDGTRFRLDLNLQNLSMISIATKLWDSQGIKTLIKNNFSGQDREYPDKNWREISKLVVQYANSINLPPSILVLLKNTILLIGQKIYDWILYVTKILKLDLVFTKKIFWNLGVVDEIKIFDLYWRNLMTSDDFIYQSDYFSHSPLSSLACMFGCERFVKERKNEMLDELGEFYHQIKEGDKIDNIMSVSICVTEQVNVYENVASPLRMFEVCLEKGYSKAARFYWKKLDEVEKVSNLTNFAEKCCRKYNYPSFLMEKFCENLLFLINQMEEEELSLFFTDYAYEIIRLLLPIWPYQTLIIDLLKYDWNIELSGLQSLSDLLISFSERMNRLGLPLDNEVLFEIMRKAWRNILVDEKLFFLKSNASDTSRLFLTLNPWILNLIFNDPSITEVDRKEMVFLIKNGFTELVKMGEFDFLNMIIETIFNYIPEPKEFLKENISNFKFVRDLIENDESFGLLDQFLYWASESEAERVNLKKKINTITVCRSLTEPLKGSFNFELADNFLKWRLESDVEVKSFKEAMKTYNFVIVDYGDYVRIKAGDLSWLRPGDSLVTLPDEDLYVNTDGLTFLKFEDAAELTRGVVLGLKSFGSFVRDNWLDPDGGQAYGWHVDYVGTKVGDYIVFIVLKIWVKSRASHFNLKRVVNLSNAFIKFYYETDQEVAEFKSTKLHVLVTENPMKFLLEPFKGRKDIPLTVLDDFCEFCMITSEEIQEIKNQQRSVIEKFLDTYLIDQLNFYLADYYLNWLFGEVKKTGVYKRFLNSSNKGALLCDSFLKDWGDDECPLGEWEFKEICRLLSLIDDMEKLRNDVYALNENTPEWFPTLLDQAAQCSYVNSIW